MRSDPDKTKVLFLIFDSARGGLDGRPLVFLASWMQASFATYILGTSKMYPWYDSLQPRCKLDSQKYLRRHLDK